MRRLAIAFAAAAAFAASAAAQSNRIGLTWRSTPDDAAAQTGEVTRLYLALYNSGNLRTRIVRNAEGRLVEPLALSQGVLVGTGLPAALDALFCDLNVDICRRERQAVPASAFPDLAGHVGGYAVTPAGWRFGPGAEIRLPDYRFETFTTLRARQVAPDWSPSDFAAADGLDCSRWGVSCKDLVGELNPKLLQQEKVARATLPVAGYATAIQIGYEANSRYAKGLDKRRLPVPGLVAPQTAWSASFAAFAARSNLTDLVLDTLGPNVILVSDLNEFSHTEEPLFNEQVDLFRLINHPFGASSELAAPYRHAVGVLVLDSPFEGRHCDLALEPAAAAGETAATGACADIAPQPNPISDHAPHVIGLINAPINHKGIVGLNPFSTVSFQPINKGFSAEDDLLDAQTKLQAGALGGARVANLSWGFEQLHDNQQAFAFAVDAIHKKMLIVAAAGNHGRDLSDNCVWIPACLHELPNVVTVVGLDRDADDPHLWSVEGQGSNSNAAFHVAAIADGVLSAVAGNRLGKLSGTSQAAPQVTATASLIYSAAEDIYPELTAGRQRLAPKIVKDRLVYSADLFRGLQTKVLGGRLNVDRAIRIVDTQLVLKRAAAEEGGEDVIEHVSGNLVQFPSGGMVICLSPDGAQVNYHWSNIRRLSYDPDRKRFVIFRHAAPSDDPSNRNDYPLQRINDCNMITRNNEAVLATERGDVTFLLKEVLDYTSPLLE